MKEIGIVNDKIRLLKNVLEKKQEEIERIVENLKALQANYSDKSKETFHDARVPEIPKSEHNTAEIESLKAVTAAQDTKLSDYIVESFVRFNCLETKLDEVINFVNIYVFLYLM